MCSDLYLADALLRSCLSGSCCAVSIRYLCFLHLQNFMLTPIAILDRVDQCTSLNPSTPSPPRRTRGSWDGSIREVARATGKVRRTFYLGDLVMSMALSGEDRLLVAVGNSVLCADLAPRRGETETPVAAAGVNEDELCQLQLRHSCPITALTACPSGRFIFYGDGALRRGVPDGGGLVGRLLIVNKSTLMSIISRVCRLTMCVLTMCVHACVYCSHHRPSNVFPQTMATVLRWTCTSQRPAVATPTRSPGAARAPARARP